MTNPGRVVSDNDDILAREIICENTGEKDTELSLVDDFLNEVDIRMEQVKVYYPIMEMLRKRNADEALTGMVPELSFLILSYLIYEGKLKHRGITFEQINVFLNKALFRILHTEPGHNTVNELAKALLDALQNAGRNFILNAYRFQTRNYREKYVKFLEIKPTENGILEYFITEQGVDFYLKTKEFPDETKITINLLLFQKQMEKGAFGFAYETVRRLNMEVEKKKDKKYSILEALMHGQIDSGEAYHNYHRSIVSQFEEESELFHVAMQNVADAYQEYIDRINKGEASERETRTFTLIKIIEKEVGRAQTLHTELLREAAGFTKEYDKVLGLRRKALFTERFSFQGEFERLTGQSRNPETLKFLFEPLLSPHIGKSFNPLRVFEPQSIVKSKIEDKEADDSETDEGRETMDQITRSRVYRNFTFYAARLLECLSKNKSRIYLSDFCCELTARYSEESVYNGDFISFILEMNRDKPLSQHKRVLRFSDWMPKSGEEVKTLEEFFACALHLAEVEGKINQMTVESFPEEEVELLPGLKVTNMLFTGEYK